MSTTKAKSKKKTGRKRQRLRAPPSPHAYAFTIADSQAMGGPGKTKVYELGKKGVLELFEDGAGRTMITGKSLRALLHVSEEI